jgi:hypothetical protein
VVVGDDGAPRRDGLVGDDATVRVVLQPGDEPDAPGREGREPGEVEVAHIEDQHGARLEGLGAGDRGFLAFPLGDDEQGGQIAVVVQGEVQLHRALAAAKRGPGKHLGAQVDHGGIETEELVLEAQAFARRDRPTAVEELVEDVLIQLPGAVRIRVAEGRAFRDADPQMAEALLAAREAATDLAQRMRAA